MFQAASAVITAALIFGIGPAFADHKDAYGHAIVPARYASGPFVAPVKLHRIKGKRQIVCGGKKTIGCAVVKGGLCHIMIVAWLPPDQYRGVLHHEQAHCRGWPADHRH